MTISIEQASTLLHRLEPLVLDDDYSHPVVTTHWCVTPTVLKLIGIKDNQLEGMPFYDGMDTVTRGGYAVRVHVIEIAKLEEYTRMSFALREKLRLHNQSKERV